MKREPSGTIATSAGIATIAAGDNYVSVDHTLGDVPSSVIITPLESASAPLEVLESSISDSAFTVRFVGGVTLDDDAKFSWMVL